MDIRNAQREDFQQDLKDSEVIAEVRELEPLAVRLTFENVE